MSLSVHLFSEEEKICNECGGSGKKEEELFSGTVTHNMAKMAEAAGIYRVLWRPDEIQLHFAKDLIKPLEEGLEKLKKDPKHYIQFEPKNRYGNYDGFVIWIKQYLEACKENPDARVNAWR